MKPKNVKIVLCAATAILTFTTMNLPARAATTTASALPSAGINYTFSSNPTSLKTIKEEVESEKKTTEENSVPVGTELATAAGVEAEEAAVIEETKPITPSEKVREEVLADIKRQIQQKNEEEGYRSLVIAKVTDYVNVRSMPSEEGEIIGKLYDKSVGSFVSEQDGWYEITSGSVTGFVKAEYCVTGDEAVELAKQVGTRIATVNTTTLKVREQPGLDTTVLGLIPNQDELIVTEEVDGWLKVSIEEGEGYISKDYVELSTEFVRAESKAEEEARLAKEEAERKAAQAAARRAAGAATESQSANEPAAEQQTQSYASSGGSAMGRSVADYALQFVGNPYVYGGTSLTNGADCSGFVLSVYANFGVSLPHSSAADRNVGSAVNGLANAQPGDLICYSGHVALYIGNGQIVHASTAKTGIKISNADYRTILSIRRIF